MAPGRMLVVDDESAVLFAYKKVFQKPDMIVDAVESKAKGFRLLRKHIYDVAILDLQLAGDAREQGFELIKAIRSNWPKTRIMLITAHGNREVQAKARSLGAEFCFEKPISTRIIQEALRPV